MANFDTNVVINVTGDAPAVPSRSFSTILVIAAAASLGVGFTERSRAYESAAAVAADLAAGDISAATAAKLNAWLAQSPRTGKVLVGRADLEAQAITIEITTPADGTWTLTFTSPSGVEITKTYVASGSATASAIASGLRTTFNVAAVAGVTCTGSGAEIVLTVSVPGDNDITDVEVTAAAGGASTVTEDTAGVPLTAELDAILADNAAFYCVCQEAVSKTLNLRLAEWTRSNGRLGMLQTSDADVITSASDDLASTLKTALDDRCAVIYHATAGHAEAPSFLVPAKKLAANPDRQSTAWAYVQVTGLTPQNVSATAKGYIVAKNANVYGLFGGAGSFQPGKTPAGNWIDQRIAFDWVEARAREAVQQLLINVSNRNGKLGMDDAGIQAVASVIAAVLLQGEQAGHFAQGSTSVSAPAAADLTTSEKQTGALTITAQGEVRVGIYTVTSNITLVIDLASLSIG